MTKGLPKNDPNDHLNGRKLNFQDHPVHRGCLRYIAQAMALESSEVNRSGDLSRRQSFLNDSLKDLYIKLKAHAISQSGKMVEEADDMRNLQATPVVKPYIT
jgi:hypothetical protein